MSVAILGVDSMPGIACAMKRRGGIFLRRLTPRYAPVVTWASHGGRIDFLRKPVLDLAPGEEKRLVTLAVLDQRHNVIDKIALAWRLQWRCSDSQEKCGQEQETKEEDELRHGYREIVFGRFDSVGSIRNLEICRFFLLEEVVRK